MMKHRTGIGLLRRLTFSCLFLLVLDTTHSHGEDQKNASVPGWKEEFSQKSLDPKMWRITRSGDFKENRVDIIDVGRGKPLDLRLRLRANTLRTNDKTVKFLGVRGVPQINFKDGVEISLDLDWNDQANGSYLTAAIYLCPTITGKNPQEEPDWIRLEYLGVPPGRNARAAVASRSKGRVQWLYTEGWPDANKSGRKIGLQHLTLQIDSKRWVIYENGNELYRAEAHELDFTQAYLYLQMSSHSNYPAREVYFDNIAVRPL